MYTLGINAAYHDPAACLVKDGIVLAAAEDERFTHFKHGKRPLPFSTPCSQVIAKLSDRRSLLRIATRRWASVRSSISISRDDEL